MYLSCALYAFIEFALLICVCVYIYIYIYKIIIQLQSTAMTRMKCSMITSVKGKNLSHLSFIFTPRKISMSFRKLIIMLNLWLNMGLGICFAEEF
jgi:hypothetical protein